MSELSGYDSEVLGFDSITTSKRLETSSSTQTNYGETGVGTQTNISRDCGSMASPDELNAGDDLLKEYPPPGLNEFLRRVVPGMLEQLDQNEKDDSSESDEEETIMAKLFQEIKVANDSNGAGDQNLSVLSLSWSSAANSLAVSIGSSQHDDWCEHEGIVRVYTVKKSAGDLLVHSLDISEKNCVTSVKYHPSVAALLAYGTTSGEVVICNLSNAAEDMQLTSPSGCHGSKRVSALLWADSSLSNTFLIMQITNTGKRRSASDQILISSGCDGTINVWQVNANSNTFQSVVGYNINGATKLPAPDITCFDFIKSFPLRPSQERVSEDLFVVGTSIGKLFLCNIKNCQPIADSNMVDPVIEEMVGHNTCVLDVGFSHQKPGIFASVSMDSELRVYDVNQNSPLKVFIIDAPLSCMAWLPGNPCVVVGSASEGVLSVYHVSSGRKVAVAGLQGAAVKLHVSGGGTCRIAAGDANGAVRIFDLPSRRIRLAPDDLYF